MATKRSYDDFCAAAHALDIVGERWALLIVRELLLGPRRFSDLRAGLVSISPNVLTQRLGELESAGVIERRKLGPPAGVWIYALTPWGQELEPILLRLAHWGVRSPAFARGKPISGDSLLLSFKAMYHAPPAGGSPVHIQLLIDGQAYWASIDADGITALRGHAGSPVDATVEAGTPVLLRLAYGGADPQAMAMQGALRYTGSLNALRRFFSAFRLPEQIEPMLHGGR
ncbi:transcriptional regulator [Pusillimonas sp. TS35]|uniref:winged helix-turn-helix transcriptional regulator n=1 Tax=Paracandidimonas lactea TaxID=2895524 RepID=UPI001369BF38|nr:winged helix-turn-helix transcriptional regulator [Paracandidimonas lactea]MYN14652.1 transcriptional regulator [Pusillimonas sp. TS35]